MLTHNRADFEALHRLYMDADQHHSGIFLAVRGVPHEIARRLLEILDQMTADEMRDHLRYV